MDELLELAQELDGMDRDVNHWEATFLQDILNQLRVGETLSQHQEAKLREIHEQYLGADAAPPREDNDGY